MSKKAIQNSRAAKPSKKKLNENKIKSSLTPPHKIVKQYNVSHVNSE